VNALNSIRVTMARQPELSALSRVWTRKLRCLACTFRAVDAQQYGGNHHRAEDACIITVGSFVSTRPK
jgi:hypothetical protein